MVIFASFNGNTLVNDRQWLASFDKLTINDSLVKRIRQQFKTQHLIRGQTRRVSFMGFRNGLQSLPYQRLACPD